MQIFKKNVDIGSLSNDELDARYKKCKDEKEKERIKKEERKRATTFLETSKQTYNIDCFINNYEWDVVYTGHIFCLCNDKLGIVDRNTLIHVLNKKLMLDAIIARTTKDDQYSPILEQLIRQNGKTLLYINSEISKCTNSNKYEMGIREAHLLCLCPSILKDKDIEYLKKEKMEVEDENVDESTIGGK